MKEPKKIVQAPKTIPLWVNYSVKWTFLSQLCGSVPSDPELVQRWLEAREPKTQPPSSKTIDQIQQEVFETTIREADEEVPISKLVFQRVSGGLVLRAATFRAHMKDCARTISSLYVGKLEGERSYAQRVIQGVYHDEATYWIPILDSAGKQYTEACGTHDKAVHARGPRGQQLNSLKQFEWVLPASVEFKIKVLGGCVKQKDLETLFQYGGVHGYGGERGDGMGRYTFELTAIEDEA